MNALDRLLAAIDAMAPLDDSDRGTHYVGCEAVHPRCAVYRAADAVRRAGRCRWRTVSGGYLKAGCGDRWFPDYVAMDKEFCPSCGGRIVEVGNA